MSRLVALTEKLLLPNECGVGQSQDGVDTDTFTRSHGVQFATTHFGANKFTIHQKILSRSYEVSVLEVWFGNFVGYVKQRTQQAVGSSARNWKPGGYGRDCTTNLTKIRRIYIWTSSTRCTFFQTFSLVNYTDEWNSQGTPSHCDCLSLTDSLHTALAATCHHGTMPV